MDNQLQKVMEHVEELGFSPDEDDGDFFVYVDKGYNHHYLSIHKHVKEVYVSVEDSEEILFHFDDFLEVDEFFPKISLDYRIVAKDKGSIAYQALKTIGGKNK